jgi:hypothetical protein
MKLETTKQRLQELAAINNPFLKEDSMASSVASEALSMLAHPDLKKQIEALYDMLDSAQMSSLKRAYDNLYNELKKYE